MGLCSRSRSLWFHMVWWSPTVEKCEKLEHTLRPLHKSYLRNGPSRTVDYQQDLVPKVDTRFRYYFAEYTWRNARLYEPPSCVRSRSCLPTSVHSRLSAACRWNYWHKCMIDDVILKYFSIIGDYFWIFSVEPRNFRGWPINSWFNHENLEGFFP